jgi:DNA (cytosine-5)-methyltransferase 1
MQHDNQIAWGGLQDHQTPRNDGISPTLTAAMGMGGGQTPIFTERRENVKVGKISSDGSQCGSVYSDDGNMGTLTAGTHGNANPHICTNYRIRKLTERECWRLMSFSDEDFEKAATVNSKTQLYKQAGNSIVKNVLMAIFGQMLPEKENIYKESVKGSGKAT